HRAATPFPYTTPSDLERWEPPPFKVCWELGRAIIPEVSLEKVFVSVRIVHAAKISQLRLPIGAAAARPRADTVTELRVDDVGKVDRKSTRLNSSHVKI